MIAISLLSRTSIIRGIHISRLCYVILRLFMQGGGPLMRSGRPDGGVLWGLLAVLAFSLTMPLTRIAAPIFGGVIAGPGRAAIAALFAGAVLVARAEPRPALRDLPVLMAVGL